MRRTIGNYEMDRRKLLAMARAKVDDAMLHFTQEHGELTVTEWVHVFGEIQQRMLGLALAEEWGTE